jgi:hydroxyacylglutathione hydrolase
MVLYPLPAFSDNYIWILHDGQRALVVDPGEADGVSHYLKQSGLRLDTILVTHHHPDHTGGVAQLREAFGAKVLGPRNEPMPEPMQRLDDGDTVDALGLSFQVVHVPGHTLGHIAYYCADMDGTPLMFCGDTLFSGGCGRLFEGTPAQMHASLQKLGGFPDATRVCCTHEYTLANLRFAQAVEPANTDLSQYLAHCTRLRQQNQPTLPSSIGLEKRINPFLRVHESGVQRSAAQHQPLAAADDTHVFAALREWKNHF